MQEVAGLINIRWPMIRFGISKGLGGCKDSKCSNISEICTITSLRHGRY